MSLAEKQWPPLYKAIRSRGARLVGSVGNVEYYEWNAASASGDTPEK
jgi:hypothetical protein